MASDPLAELIVLAMKASFWILVVGGGVIFLGFLMEALFFWKTDRDRKG